MAEFQRWKGPCFHTKSVLVGPSIQIPITDGRLNLGTWQGMKFAMLLENDLLIVFSLDKGIYLTEFRHAPHARTVVATIL